MCTLCTLNGKNRYQTSHFRKTGNWPKVNKVIGMHRIKCTIRAPSFIQLRKEGKNCNLESSWAMKRRHAIPSLKINPAPQNFWTHSPVTADNHREAMTKQVWNASVRQKAIAWVCFISKISHNGAVFRKTGIVVSLLSSSCKTGTRQAKSCGCIHL